ncbi:hypothetical protein LCGC14_1038790 [marine sediment metagenome]|uniref:Uncharacterized protein n=1 Tax=marine sediment metagenome TaxID=412755 RepID=A0A0F9QYJ2_9ZZZZ
METILHKWIIPILCMLFALGFGYGYGIGGKDLIDNHTNIGESYSLANKSPHFNKTIPELDKGDTIVIQFGYDANKAIVLGNFPGEKRLYLKIMLRMDSRITYVEWMFKYSDSNLFMYKRR